MKLSVRFTVLICCAGAGLLALFSTTVYFQVRDRSYARAEQLLVNHIQHELHHVGGPVNADTEPRSPHFNEIFLQISKNGSVTYDDFPTQLSCPVTEGVWWTEGRVFFVLEKAAATGLYRLCGFYDLAATHLYLSSLRRVLAGVSFLALCLLIPFSLVGTHYLLNPFRQLAHRTNVLSAEKLSFRFKPSRNLDEYGSLVQGLNSLLERLETSFNLLKRFAVNASHELKTPLSIIISQGEIAIRRERSNEEYRTALEKMVRSAKDLRETTNRLLYMAEAESQQQVGDKDEVNLEEAVADIERSLRAVYPPSEKSFSLKPCEGERPIVRTNRELLSSVLTNVLENAFKYSNKEIEVSFAKRKGNWEIYFEDDGPGIPLGLREKIFEPFVKADPSSKKGQGLGLSIVKACLEAIRGYVLLEDSTRGGLRVRVGVPA